MTKPERFDWFAGRLKLLRAEVESIYIELWAADLHGAKMAVERAVPPISQAIQSVECAKQMQEEETYRQSEEALA